jgi:hypothetical protein
MTNTGAFSKHKRKVGLRTPQMELTKLSAPYGYLIEEEQRDIANPCSRPRVGRRRWKKSEVYRPARKSVIPSRAALKAIFEAVQSPKRKDEHPGVVYRTLFKLIYSESA